MSFQPVKGTRDFYPDEMRVRNWITDTWRRVSLRNGFEEYDSPIFEYLDLYKAKSGEGIVSELFSLTDRGGRELAIRPETTPALARMVNAKIHSLPRPIKWFTIQRCCRAERPQKGRTREFFCWNIDIIGPDDVLADAECIFVAADFLREVGLTGADVQVHIGHRGLTAAALAAAGVGEADVDRVLPVLDKRPKVSDEEFRKLAGAAGLGDEQIATVCRFQDAAEVGQVRELLRGTEGVEEHAADLERLLEYLRAMGVADYCRLDMRMVRGLAYYTGIVYEVLDRAGSLRAVAGGGRYDNLLEVLGGPKVTGTGFGMGDPVLGILLAEKGRIPEDVRSPSLDFFVIDGADGLLEKAVTVAGALRARGWAADFSYKRQNIGKQLKEANRRNARAAAILQGDGDRMQIKDLATGNQKSVPVGEFLAKLKPRSQQALDAILG